MSLKQFNESFNKYFTECFNEDKEDEILETTEDYNDDIEDISYMNFVDVNDMTSNAKEALKETYDEPELLGKGYAAPTSRDFVKDVKLSLKANDSSNLYEIQEFIEFTMDKVEEFDNYWKSHKQAIMKNIKEAQDLIPSEYRK